MGNLIWLASYPKSGNTWMRAFIANLFANRERPVDINDLAMFAISESNPHHYELISGKPVSELDTETIARLRPVVQAKLASEYPDTRFVKIHSAIMRHSGHPSVNLQVTAGAIYMVRNPLDVAVSFSHHLGVSIDDVISLMDREYALTTTTTSDVAELIGSWSQHVRSWTGRPSASLHVVRYEDMLGNPLKAFGGVAKYLQVDVSKDRLTKAVRCASFKVLQDQEGRHGFNEQSPHAPRFFRSGQSGVWKQILTHNQVDTLVGRNKEQMAQFGYLDL